MSHYELTEAEINDFIAHSDKSDEDSDWDEIGETNLDIVLDELKQTPSDSLKPQQQHSTRRVLKDVNIHEMFQSSNTSNTSLDKDFTGTPGEKSLNVDQTEDDYETISTLSEHGASILQIMKNQQHAERNRLIEKEVDKLIGPDADYDQSDRLQNDKNTCKPSSSVSLALAACVDRRKKAISDLNSRTISESYSTRESQQIATTTANKTTKSKGDDCESYWIAKPTNLRVYRTQISSEVWHSRTSERLVLNLAQFAQRSRQMAKSDKSNSNESVVVAVIGSKTPARRSRNDKMYSIWCLTDLDRIGPGSSDGCVKLFLFGNCHDKLWKESDGRIVALLNPRNLSSSSYSDSKDVGITIESPLHVMILGDSPDYGICSATTKSNQPCSRVINKSVCRYCDFHVKKAYFAASSSRPGFASSSLPQFGKPSKKYRGDVSCPRPEPGVYHLPISQAFQPIANEARTKLNVAKLTKAGYQLDSTNGLGSLANGTKNGNSPMVKPGESPSLNTAETKLVRALCRPSAGSLNLLRHIEMEEYVQPESNSKSTKCKQKVDKSAQIPINNNNNNKIKNSSSPITFATFFSSVKESQKTKTNFSTNTSKDHSEYIDFGPMPTKSNSEILFNSPSRQRAIALVKSKGGIATMEKENKLKRKSISSSSGEAISHHGEHLNVSKLARLESPNEADNSTSTATLLKQKRLNKLRSLSDQIKVGSAHANLVSELDHQTEQIRLNSLEKRDEFEQKLTNQHEEPCTYAICQTCNYKALKAAPDCRKDNHNLKFVKGTKRYFRCRNCSKRTVTLERYPNKSCVNCGESLFEKTGILAERKGPLLPNEQLLTRGLEEKFIG